MTGIHDNKKRIDALRARLYDRGQKQTEHTPTVLTDTPKQVATTWQEPPTPKRSVIHDTEPQDIPMISARHKKYRRLILKYSLLAFLASVIVSSLFFWFGNNSISADNINIAVSGPFTVGGGEELAIQVGVTNQNAVPIEAATLIIDYPAGARSTGDQPQDLYTERLSLDTIAAGQTVNVPLSATIYGEENAEQEVKVSLEYRIAGSNATFYKDASPLSFKISSAPVSIKVESNTKISSGQEQAIKVTVSSNSQTTLRNILIAADYPTGFEFGHADQEPFVGSNEWQIVSLEPGESYTVTVYGTVGGQTNDERVVHFNVGVPSDKDPTNLATVLATATADFVIENPFLGLELRLDNDTDGEVVAERGQPISGEIILTNTLNDTIYDAKVSLVLSGNALSDPAVYETDGYYKSSTHTITWDPSTNSHLSEILPGDSISLTFHITPDQAVVRTPTIDLAVNAESRRVSESRVPEQLQGSVTGTIKVETNASLTAIAKHVSGPLPPQSEQSSAYTVTIVAENGGNKLQNTVITFSLPPNVTWSDTTSGPGTFSYNPTSRQVTWQAGDIEALGRATAIVGVSIEPSVGQIGTTPTLVDAQTLRGTDAYTGTTIKTTSAAITTEMKTDDSAQSGNGRVVE